ncbi:MAG TPA: hypothetical protein VKU19_11895 [Bryobacteraceae bacterium]|nr:hypothetical protein [Bryobacteraceae bacterium]
MFVLFYASVGCVIVVLICWLVILKRQHARRLERQAKMLRTLRTSQAVGEHDWSSSTLPGTGRV